MPLKVRKIHIEPAARGIVRGECQTQETAFAASADCAAEIQKIGGLEHSIDDDPNTTALFDNVLDMCGRWILDKGNGLRESRDVRFGTYLTRRSRGQSGND
jgi:hypothetical protein